VLDLELFLQQPVSRR